MHYVTSVFDEDVAVVTVLDLHEKAHHRVGRKALDEISPCARQFVGTGRTKVALEKKS